MRGVDSFVGEIGDKDFNLSFDYSEYGYASNLIETEDQYLQGRQWLHDCPLMEPGVTYTSRFNVHGEKVRQMKEKGITDSTLVKVEVDPCFAAKKLTRRPTSAEQARYPKVDFIGILTYKGKSITIPIQIPKEIREHFINVDTTNRFIIKTIRPKVTGEGMTGIYFKSRSSDFSFQLSGENLSELQEEQALMAFKTIQFKNK